MAQSRYANAERVPTWGTSSTPSSIVTVAGLQEERGKGFDPDALLADAAERFAEVEKVISG